MGGTSQQKQQYQRRQKGVKRGQRAKKNCHTLPRTKAHLFLQPSEYNRAPETTDTTEMTEVETLSPATTSTQTTPATSTRTIGNSINFVLESKAQRLQGTKGKKLPFLLRNHQNRHRSTCSQGSEAGFVAVGMTAPLPPSKHAAVRLSPRNNISSAAAGQATLTVLSPGQESPESPNAKTTLLRGACTRTLPSSPRLLTSILPPLDTVHDRYHLDPLTPTAADHPAIVPCSQLSNMPPLPKMPPP